MEGGINTESNHQPNHVPYEMDFIQNNIDGLAELYIYIYIYIYIYNGTTLLNIILRILCLE